MQIHPFCKFDQSLLSPYLFSIAFILRLKKGEMMFLFGVFMVAS